MAQNIRIATVTGLGTGLL